MSKIQLGDEVKHPITGVKGIVVSITEYVSGCKRMNIQQKVNKDGTLPDGLSFDEPELEVTKAKKPQIKKNKTGGWKPNVSREQKNVNNYKN